MLATSVSGSRHRNKSIVESETQHWTLSKQQTCSLVWSHSVVVRAPTELKKKVDYHVAVRLKKELLGITRTIPCNPDLLNCSWAAVESNLLLIWSAR